MTFSYCMWSLHLLTTLTRPAPSLRLLQELSTIAGTLSLHSGTHEGACHWSVTDWAQGLVDGAITLSLELLLPFFGAVKNISS